MCFPLASQIEGVANSTPDARSQRGRVPEPEFDGLLLAARTRGAVRVRPKPRLRSKPRPIDVRERSLARLPRIATALHPVEVMLAGRALEHDAAVTKTAPAPDAAAVDADRVPGRMRGRRRALVWTLVVLASLL